jgi:methylthioxylose transferase
LHRAYDFRKSAPLGGQPTNDGPSLASVAHDADSVTRKSSVRIRVLAATASALAGWTGLVWLTHVWGDRLVGRDRAARIFAAPLAGRLDPRLGLRVLPVLAVAAAAVSLVPKLARSLGWRKLLVGGMALCAAWAVALAFVDGSNALKAPLATRWDYLVDVPKVGSVTEFLQHFASRLDVYSTHVRAHPPGMLLLLSLLDRLGLGGPGPAAALVIAGGSAAVPAALLAVRDMAGERAARAAWPFLAFAPAALWIATSADALYAGVSAWGVALVVLATGRRDRRGDLMAAAGGLLLGAAAFLSYGLVLIAAVLVPVAVYRRRLRPLLVAAAGAAIVAGAFALIGFWWLDGLTATRVQYLKSAARARPQHYFWIGNLGSFALALGPAAVVGATRLRGRGVAVLVAGGLLAVALADASGFSRGEVERIWLPFVPWILVAGASLGEEGATRAWLTLQLALALAIQLIVRSPW